MNATAGSICLVVDALAHGVGDGDIGTYGWELAHVLAGVGWRVHILSCGPLADSAARVDVSRRLAAAGIGFSNLDAFTMPSSRGVPAIFGEPEYLLRSDKVRHALEQLHRECPFDLVEFADRDALGFRTIQAVRSGLAFHDVDMIVKLHGSNQWAREGNLAWMADSDDLRRDFCERYAFENATVQMSPSRYMLEYARTIHWKVRADARVLRNPFPEPVLDRKAECGPATPEVVFVGRLDAPNGLEVFVQAAKNLDPRIALRFVGKDGCLPHGGSASGYIQAQLKDRDVSLLTHLNWAQTLTYLSTGNRLAVLPSLVEHFPYAVVECAVNGIPFLASRLGGIPEILPDMELQARLLFAPNPRDLLRCLESYLQADAFQRRALGEQAQKVTDVSTNRRQVAECYSQILQARHRRSASTAPSLDDDPLVTVCVPFYNLGAYLPDTLASLAAQTYSKLEVLVIDDGSTDTTSIHVLEEQQRHYPQFRFLSQINAGLDATRNRGIAEAKGEYFLPVDADNIATPQMVERFVAAIRRRPDVSALTCYFLAFKETADIAREEFCYAYRPTGGSHVLGSIQNVYGDANAIYRLADLHAIGGHETEGDTGEDWELFVKLVNAGYQVDVLPDYLFYYRHREDSLVRTTSKYRNHRRVLRQYFRLQRLPEVEQMALWTALVSLHIRLTQCQSRQSSARYRIADELADFLDRFPRISRFTWTLLRCGRQMWKRISFRIREKR